MKIHCLLHTPNSWTDLLIKQIGKKKNEMDEENKHTRENFKIEEWFMIIKISSINHYKGH